MSLKILNRVIISSAMTGTLGCWYIIEITIRHQYIIMMQCHKCTVPESDTQLSDLLMQAIKIKRKGEAIWSVRFDNI